MNGVTTASLSPTPTLRSWNGCEDATNYS